MSSMVAVAAIGSPTNYYQSIYADAMFVMRDSNLMLPLVTTFGDRTGIAPRTSSQYGTATIQDISDTDDLASQAFTPATLATLTPTERGAQFFITDTRKETDPFGVAADASSELGNAISQKIEKDLIAAFSSLTGGTVGAAGTVIAWGHFYAMLSRLRAGNVPGPYAFVCHPYHWHVLGKAVTPGSGGAQVNAPDFQNAAMQNFYQTTVSGVQIYTSANISIDGSDDARCAMFNPMAIGMDVRRAPRLEPQRDASRRGDELNLSTIYAAGVWRPAFGIQGLFDASLPTS